MRIEAKEAPTTGAELTVITAVQAIVPAQFFAPGGSEDVLAALEGEVRKIASGLDISTETGRAGLASLAYKVARSKTALDDQGKALVVDLKAKAGAIDKERGKVWDRVEALQKEVRKPLTDWENAEKERVAAHEAALAAIPESEGYGATETSAELSARLAYLQNYPPRDWQEFKDRANKEIAAEMFRTGVLLARAEKREAEHREAERLAAEARERAIKEREEAAAKAAKEEAERKAAEQARIAREAAERERQRVENERVQAEARAKQAEAQRVAAEQEAARKLAEAEERRKREAEDAARLAKEAQERAERERLAAVEAERQRAAAEKKREAEEAEARAKDKANKAAKHRAILAALVKIGVPEDPLGKEIVAAITKGEIPHLRIDY